MTPTKQIRMQKKVLKKSRSYMSGVMATITLNIYAYCLQDGYIYLNLTIFVTQLMKFSKCKLYANAVFVETNLDSCHPKTHVPRNYLQIFYLASLIHKCGGKNNIHLLSFEILLQAEGQDHITFFLI